MTQKIYLLILSCVIFSGCATQYTPITRQTMDAAVDSKAMTAIATRDHGLLVLSVDGEKADAEVVYVKPGQHTLLLEITRLTKIVIGGTHESNKGLYSVELDTKPGHSYAILGIANSELSRVDIFADDKGENYDVECFFWHRIVIPDSYFTQCKDPAVKGGMVLPADQRLTDKSVQLKVLPMKK